MRLCAVCFGRPRSISALKEVYPYYNDTLDAVLVAYDNADASKSELPQPITDVQAQIQPHLHSDLESMPLRDVQQRAASHGIMLKRDGNASAGGSASGIP